MATVEDLKKISDQGRFLRRQFQDVSIALGETLRVGDSVLTLDEAGLDALGIFLGIPRGYLGKVSPHLADENVRYFLAEDPEAFALFETDGRNLLGVYDGDREILPRERVADVICSVMRPGDELNYVDLSGGRLVAEVTTDRIATQPRVGDFTHGGLRFEAHVAPAASKGRQPRVCCFMNRLACSNGMTHEEEYGSIRVKGNTVDEVLEEMEQIARHLLDEQVPVLVHRFGALAERAVGNPEQYVHRLARQHGVKAALETAMIERLPSLGDAPTAYDIVNMVSAFQHEDGVNRATALRLQALAGETAWGSEGEHRCPTCQTPLEA